MPHSASNHQSALDASQDMALRSIEAIREMRGYSIDNLAVTSGLTWQEIVDVEHGRTRDIRLLRRMATALRVSIETLPEYTPTNRS